MHPGSVRRRTKAARTGLCAIEQTDARPAQPIDLRAVAAHRQQVLMKKSMATNDPWAFGVLTHPEVDDPHGGLLAAKMRMSVSRFNRSHAAGVVVASLACGVLFMFVVVVQEAVQRADQRRQAEVSLAQALNRCSALPARIDRDICRRQLQASMAARRAP